MNFRERLERDRVSRFAANDNVNVQVSQSDSEYFGISNAGNLPACVDLRFADGGRMALPYSFITEIRFEPSTEILIIINGKKITVSGRDMEKLYDFLAMFRVRFIKALNGDGFDEGGLCVTAIEVKEAG